LGIPIYVAVAPFLLFHPLEVLDLIGARVTPLHPTEGFREVLNPKGSCVRRVAQSLEKSHQSAAKTA
jgi:hypothetical protein